MSRNCERAPRLHEQPGLAYKAWFLTRISTETILEAVGDPTFNTRATRTVKALMLAELCYRVSRLCYKPFFGIFYDDVGMNRRAWADVFGPRIPMPRGFGAASNVYPHEREWVRLDQVQW